MNQIISSVPASFSIYFIPRGEGVIGSKFVRLVVTFAPFTSMCRVATKERAFLSNAGTFVAKAWVHMCLHSFFASLKLCWALSIILLSFSEQLCNGSNTRFVAPDNIFPYLHSANVMLSSRQVPLSFALFFM